MGWESMGCIRCQIVWAGHAFHRKNPVVRNWGAWSNAPHASDTLSSPHPSHRGVGCVNYILHRAPYIQGTYRTMTMAWGGGGRLLAGAIYTHLSSKKYLNITPTPSKSYTLCVSPAWSHADTFSSATPLSQLAPRVQLLLHVWIQIRTYACMHAAQHVYIYIIRMYITGNWCSNNRICIFCRSLIIQLMTGLSANLVPQNLVCYVAIICPKIALLGWTPSFGTRHISLLLVV